MNLTELGTAEFWTRWIAIVILDLTLALVIVPATEWTGAAFLTDRWELDDRQIRTALGFKPARDPAGIREALRRAIGRTWQDMRQSG